MKLWLSQRFGRAKPGEASSAASGQTLGKAMGIESLEHIVRNRVRMFLRNTWLVAILGTLLIGAGICGAIYISTAPTDMRIAAGPAGSTDVKFVQLLAERFASERDKIRLHLVTTDGPKESAEALANGSADLAILPSTTGNSLVWPVVAIVRQNVMALIVPASPPSVPAKKEATPPPKKEETAGTEKEQKAGKDAKKAAVAAKGTAKGAKNDKNDKSGKGAKNAKVAKKGDTDEDDRRRRRQQQGHRHRRCGQRQQAGQGHETRRASRRHRHRQRGDDGLAGRVLNHYGVPRGQVQVSLSIRKTLPTPSKPIQVDVLFVAGPSTGTCDQ